MKRADPIGATPIDPDEVEYLIPTHITTRADLNEWENANILEAESWAFSRRRSDLLTPAFMCRLHKEMFGRTWIWAGEYRKSDKNIGLPWQQVPVEVRKLCDDCRFWIDNGTFGVDETAARLHHRLVVVHPFINGNGRHARLMADLLLFNQDKARFQWGRGSLQGAEVVRDRYLKALYAADDGDYGPLLRFLQRR